eukprot:4596731-Pyramimonas_sp.AAC.1
MNPLGPPQRQALIGERFRRFPSPTYQKWRFGKIRDYAGATITLVLCVEILRVAFWHDSKSPRCNTQVDPWHWNPGNPVLAYFRVFKR